MDGSQPQSPWTPRPISEGAWAGWSGYTSDPFETLAGPFYSRREPGGDVVCAFRAEAKHMNGGGFMHGGALATFADFALFMIAEDALKDTGSVTASLNCEFIDAARAGELVEARGQVVRAGGSMVFVRGLAASAGRPLLNFSAILKKVRRR
ncbi:MAG TPA: PaaI family thioesterase [Caulobacteraceae bacterium]|nr:PaaI family thioesterase [Caulobacteraceae bacterium]